jgi:hypothetical protein
LRNTPDAGMQVPVLRKFILRMAIYAKPKF